MSAAPAPTLDGCQYRRLDAMLATLAAAQAATAWLDAHNGRDREQVGCRLLKLAEETGEVVAAWFGTTGNNPRKGITHTTADVAAELVDVIITALVALHSLDLDPAEALTSKARTVARRLGPIGGQP